ncbi:hypothetical protein H8356DRAFT_1056480 [Neocallimastix lanati (nom. inval.)]|uniref:Uncharacterized protein n=1 Tax=Neocallimastix californiae TaxID=1754190 RepID=A0A1Y2C298_9FUNG|nr:hypothetical protein H8356DRAFT_1056480 [Neocallimastix sp. JGI-2020a]ORY41131.1 hypothetical protein LY90DRAFT_672075 [Neocallimastix californiae]|eukprot:ORY41131.1 hypothetical protein LY90DRAFT_672075 [Neocallimastix californiae]
MAKIKNLLFFLVIIINIVCIYGLNNLAINNRIKYENCKLTSSLENTPKTENHKHDIRNSLINKFDNYSNKQDSIYKNKAYYIMTHSYGSFKWFNNILRNNKNVKVYPKINQIIPTTNYIKLIELKLKNNMTLWKNIVIGILLFIIYHLNA